MEYNSIVNVMRYAYLPEKAMFYHDLSAYLKDIYFASRGVDLSEAKSYMSTINGIRIMLIDSNHVPINKENIVPFRLVENKKTKVNCCDIVYFEGDVMFVVFINPLKNGDISTMFNNLFVVMEKLTTLISARMIGDNKDVFRNTTYGALNAVASIVLSIKTLQSVMVDFSQDDIRSFIRVFAGSIKGDKEVAKTFIDLCFQESLEDILEKGVAYEYSLKVDDI